ncbi:CTP synthetase [Ruegeria sp. ANG10]|uniref:CTP synthetase n=1 Tax=Ruegeria sp. ANG10 TaxID=3042467 RepID=UPI0034568309
MSPLTLILHIFLGSTLAGAAVIAVLAMGYTSSWTTILIAAVVGFVAAFPVSYLVARKLEG